MAAFSLANDEVVRATLQIMGLGRDASAMDAATEADVRAVIRSGLRRFYFPVSDGMTYQWRFLERHKAISAEAIFDDGTIEVSAGTVTLTGGTWPTDLTNYFVVVSGHVLFITSRDSATEATTSNTQLTVAAGTSYDAYKYRYSLPSDFAEWQGGVVYQNGDTDDYSRTLAGTTEADIRLRYAGNYGSLASSVTHDRTTHFAVTATPDSGTFSIVFWPVPRPNAFIQGVYLATPDDNLPADLTTPGSVTQVQPIYAEAVLEAILTAAEEYNADMQGVHAARFEAALKTAILHDKAVGGHYDFSRRSKHKGLGHGPVLPSITFN